jgi:hypothetical protein
MQMQIINAALPRFAGMPPPVVPAKKINQADSAVPKLDLVAGALEMKLVMLSIELSSVIDKALEARMQAQKDRNAQIENLNDLLNELRKLQKSSATFSADSLDNAYIDLPPGSSLSLQSAERIRSRGIEVVKNADWNNCLYIESWELATISGSTDFMQKHTAMLNEYVVDSILTGFNGDYLRYFCHRRDNGREAEVRIKTYNYSTMHHPSWPSDAAAVNYRYMQDALAKLNAEFIVNSASGKASLGDLLYGYGVYKEGESLPTTKEDLEAANEKISAMVGTITSTQSLKMLDIQKFTNGRNEAYDLAVSVNNSKFESLKSLISMIGEH